MEIAGFKSRLLRREIVVVALFDHGGVGQYAATIVRDVVKCYFDKKTRLETWRLERSTIVAGGSFLHAPRN